MVRKKKILQVEGKVREIHSKLGKKRSVFQSGWVEVNFFINWSTLIGFFIDAKWNELNQVSTNKKMFLVAAQHR